MRLIVLFTAALAGILLVFPFMARALDTQDLRVPDQRQSSQAVRALELAGQGKWDEAYGRLSGGAHPAARKTLDWLAYRYGAPTASYAEIVSFVNQNPDWPHLNRLRLEAEDVMPENLAASQVVAWFGQKGPLTPDGMEQYLRSLVLMGDIQTLRRVIRDWWADVDLDRDQQKRIYKTYKAYLDHETNLKRFNALLYRGDSQNALGMARVLGGDYVALAKARLALSQNMSNVDGLVDAVPVSLQSDPGLMYERLRWRRRADLNSGMIEILDNAPALAEMHDPSSWWLERHILARRYLEQKNYAQAYRVASSHVQEEGFPLAQAEWLSGWIALRFLNKPDVAFNHFEKLYHNVSTPISRARGAYWAGRACDEMGYSDIARQWYREGAKHQHTFYGQMAAAVIDAPVNVPSSEKVASANKGSSKIYNHEFVMAASWLAKADLRYEAGLFLNAAMEQAQNESDYAYLASLAEDLGIGHVAIQIASEAENEKGIILADYAYPDVSSKLAGVDDVEWALIHALIRQESRFNQKAVSHAGARGLMQLMPATAEEVARRRGYAHRTSWLTERPDHNIRLGSVYLNEMLERFDGSYILALAAYNAGPNRVERWIREIGDPRRDDIDAIDWIELIPIYETRNYVQRVMESIYVYRHRLKNIQEPPETPIHIAMR